MHVTVFHVLLFLDKLRPTVDTSASIHSRHDVATPPESPKPVAPPVARPVTPPILSPREIKEEPLLVSWLSMVIF